MISLEPVAVDGWAFGVPIALKVEGSLRERVGERLPPGWQPGPVPHDARTWSVTSGPEVDAVLGEVQLHFAEHAPRLVFIHAGAVVIDGRALLLPGRSLAGKSTLALELIRLGATYYSDEFAVLDEAALVLPYPRPLALRATATEPALRLAAESLGQVGSTPAVVGLVAHLQRDVASGWRVEPTGSARTVLALIDNAVAAQSRTKEVLARCAAVAGAASGLRGTRGDAREAAEHLIALMRG